MNKYKIKIYNELELSRYYTVFFITPFFAMGKHNFKKRISYLFMS